MGINGAKKYGFTAINGQFTTINGEPLSQRINGQFPTINGDPALHQHSDGFAQGFYHSVYVLVVVV